MHVESPFDDLTNIWYNKLAVKTVQNLIHIRKRNPIDHKEYARDKLGDRTATWPERLRC